jgi:hypothetical protein
LGRAEAEYCTAHRQQAPKFEFEPDQEQQHHDAQFGNRDDALGRCERCKPMGADDDAGHEISDDCGEAESACNRNAQHCGAQEHESEIQKAKFGVLHDCIPLGAEPRLGVFANAVAGLLERHSPAPARFSNMDRRWGGASERRE